MNQQDSEKAATNDSATSHSQCAATEELFSAIQRENETSISRLRGDTTEISEGDTETGHRSNADTQSDENNKTFEISNHLTAFNKDDRVTTQGDFPDFEESDNACKTLSSAFKPQKVNFRPMPTILGETKTFTKDDQPTLRTLKTHDITSSQASVCKNCVESRNHYDSNSSVSPEARNPTKGFQPILRTRNNKRFKQTFGHFVDSHSSSKDDVLSVISEESLSSADIKSLNGAHRINFDNASTRLEARDKSFRSRKTSSNAFASLEDPWVRSSDSNSSTDVSMTNANPSCSTSYYYKDTSRPEPKFTEKRARLRFRTESQNELHTIERNDPQTNHRSAISDTGYENREKERNDIDLLKRPSFCDAKFALSRIEQVYISG